MATWRIPARTEEILFAVRLSLTQSLSIRLRKSIHFGSCVRVEYEFNFLWRHESRTHRNGDQINRFMLKFTKLPEHDAQPRCIGQMQDLLLLSSSWVRCISPKFEMNVWDVRAMEMFVIGNLFSVHCFATCSSHKLTMTRLVNVGAHDHQTGDVTLRNALNRVHWTPKDLSKCRSWISNRH